MSSTARGYYLQKRYNSWLAQEAGLTAVWHGKQKGEPGTALPSSLPLTKLAFPAIGLPDDEIVVGGEWFTTYEDVQGLSLAQLEMLGLTSDEAAAVCAAVEEFYD